MSHTLHTPANILLVFPGQGSQTPQMAKSWAEEPVCRLLIEEASEAIKLNLFKMMQEESAETLTQTENAQPALLVVGLAAVRYLTHASGRKLGQLSSLLAGHSLGEYTATAAAGGWDVATATQAVRLRGQAMAQATGGAMAAVLGLELAELEKALLSSPKVSIANDNCPGQIVISGPADALQVAETPLKAAGAKRVIPLAVSGAFHTQAMKPAANIVATFIQKNPLHPLTLPILANTTAQINTDSAIQQKNLVEQITSRVRWRESMATATALGITQVIELGVGKVLTGLATRCNPEWSALSLTSPREADAWLTTLHT